MNEYDETRPVRTTTIEVPLDVRRFVVAIREQLADLSDDEREELIGGLEADLTERLAESGAELGDPATYAAELRAAAGLDATRSAKERRLPLRVLAVNLARELRDYWEHQLATRPVFAQTWEVVCTLQPAWWVLRAWIAVQLLDLMSGPYEYLTVLPSLGNQAIGFVVLLGAVAVSVLLGSGRLWPGGPGRGGLARLLVTGLNLVAIVALFAVFARFPSPWDSHGLADGRLYEGYAPQTERVPGLVSNGRVVRNVFAYDAQGKPVVGVQLYDQQGRPLAVSKTHRVLTADGGGLVYPWFNGSHELFNVFPLPERTERGYHRNADVWTSSRPPALPTAPLVVVPPATLPTATPTPSPKPDSGKQAGR